MKATIKHGDITIELEGTAEEIAQVVKEMKSTVPATIKITYPETPVIPYQVYPVWPYSPNPYVYPWDVFCGRQIVTDTIRLTPYEFESTSSTLTM